MKEFLLPHFEYALVGSVLFVQSLQFVESGLKDTDVVLTFVATFPHTFKAKIISLFKRACQNRNESYEQVLEPNSSLKHFTIPKSD